LGLICLVVGLFVTVPISGLALAYTYRVLKPRPSADDAVTVVAA
jgi:uncharacterized membrane protein